MRVNQGERGVLDVLAVIRAPLEQYPPSVHQVALLAEAGLSVAIVDTWHPEFKEIHFEGQVRRIHAVPHTLSYKEKLPSRLMRIRHAWAFKRAVRGAWRELQPKVVIAYDDRACPMVGRTILGSNRARTISHFHELPQYRPGDGMGVWQATRYCGKFARSSDLVIFPDAHRADIFRTQANLVRSPVIVMNCPRRLDELPASTLGGRLNAPGRANCRVVFFQGWLGPHRGLESLVRSMKLWAAESVLVLVGPATDSYKQSLVELAEKTGVRQRVLFIGMVPLGDLDGLIAGADVAVALFPSDTSDLNFRYLAGASNKRFMYMSLAVAQVSNTGPGMSSIIERHKCGVLVDPNAPDEVGSAICSLLENEPLRKEMGRNGRRAHLEEFNYERQFAPVLNQILGWCGKGKANATRI